jgi:hypothetical protein
MRVLLVSFYRLVGPQSGAYSEFPNSFSRRAHVRTTLLYVLYYVVIELFGEDPCAKRLAPGSPAKDNDNKDGLLVAPCSRGLPFVC